MLGTLPCTGTIAECQPRQHACRWEATECGAGAPHIYGSDLPPNTTGAQVQPACRHLVAGNVALTLQSSRCADVRPPCEAEHELPRLHQHLLCRLAGCCARHSSV